MWVASTIPHGLGFLNTILIPPPFFFSVLGRQACKEYARSWRERQFGPSIWHTCAADELGWEELHSDRSPKCRGLVVRGRSCIYAFSFPPSFETWHPQITCIYGHSMDTPVLPDSDLIVLLLLKENTWADGHLSLCSSLEFFFLKCAFIIYITYVHTKMHVGRWLCLSGLSV
jgi:hypothetical protein